MCSSEEQMGKLFQRLFFQYGFTFYLQYLINHGEYFQVCEHPSGEIMGYGKFSAVIDL